MDARIWQKVMQTPVLDNTENMIHVQHSLLLPRDLETQLFSFCYQAKHPIHVVSVTLAISPRGID
jgi:hypothetical protein